MKGIREFGVDQMPTEIARKIDRMTGNLAQAWLWTGAADLRTLIRSAYFQGIQDAVDLLSRKDTGAAENATPENKESSADEGFDINP